VEQLTGCCLGKIAGSGLAVVFVVGFFVVVDTPGSAGCFIVPISTKSALPLQAATFSRKSHWPLSGLKYRFELQNIFDARPSQHHQYKLVQPMACIDCDGLSLQSN